VRFVACKFDSCFCLALNYEELWNPWSTRNQRDGHDTI
jgi:hypothetical protein